MQCQYCDNSFSTLSSLNNHQKTAKYCLKLRNIKTTSFVCTHCDRSFSSKRWLDVHIQKCKSLPSLLQDKIAILEQKLNSIVMERDMLQKINCDQASVIKELQNKLENVAIVSASRPTTNNTQINNYIQKLEVITDQHLLDQAQHLTIEHIKKGPAGYAEYAMAHPFKERLICVDYARRKVKFKESDGTLINDPEMNRLATKFFQSIKDRNTELIKEYGALLSKDFAENVDKLGELADFKVGVTRGADGEKTDFSHEVIKNVCSQSVV